MKKFNYQSFWERLENMVYAIANFNLSSLIKKKNSMSQAPIGYRIEKVPNIKGDWYILHPLKKDKSKES